MESLDDKTKEDEGALGIVGLCQENKSQETKSLFCSRLSHTINSLILFAWRLLINDLSINDKIMNAQGGNISFIEL